jgi:hypothetical protein
VTSIFETVLGREFQKLHPQIQRRFSVGLDSGEACVGTGVMEEIWHGRPLFRPFLKLGGVRNILVPEAGRNVPFTIENYPYADSFGRETVTFVRTFGLPKGQRRFDATMVHRPGRGTITDYLGTHQHLASELDLSVDAAGGLVIRSTEHRFREKKIDVRVPALISGDATVRESYDDEAQRFRIEVRVENQRFGPIFGYRGSFTASYVDVSAHGVPGTVKPLREEVRC